MHHAHDVQLILESLLQSFVFTLQRLSFLRFDIPAVLDTDLTLIFAFLPTPTEKSTTRAILPYRLPLRVKMEAANVTFNEDMTMIRPAKRRKTTVAVEARESGTRLKTVLYLEEPGPARREWPLLYFNTIELDARVVHIQERIHSFL
jgi:hypothetical protein